ncbi:Microsomal triglyceride transfer protein large subunit, partial [Gryllus bimaculatus]
MLSPWFRLLPLVVLLAALVGYSEEFVLVSSRSGSGSEEASATASASERREAERALRAELEAAPLGVFAAPGAGQRFALEATVLLNEAGARPGADVGFQLTARVDAGTAWVDPLQQGVSEAQLHIKSRKAPSPEGFVAHSSRLDALPSAPLLALWERGAVAYVWAAKGEDTALFKVKKWSAKEKDASGRCDVTYSLLDEQTVYKVKDNCINGKQVPYLAHPDPVLGAEVTSHRSATFTLSSDLALLESVVTSEQHQMAVVARPEAASSVLATQQLVRQGPVKIQTVVAPNLNDVIKEMEKREGKDYVKHITVLEREPSCVDDCPSFSQLVKEQRAALEASAVGSLRSAKAFTRLLHAARAAKREDLVKALKSSKNRDILPQLCDVLGSAQTAAAHEAAMKVLRLDADDDLDAAERYLWALSFGVHPLPHVIGEAEASLMAALGRCADDACRLRVLRALRNLASPAALRELLALAEGGSGRVAAAALRAARALPREDGWASDEAQRAAWRVFAQRRRRHDSSARTLALDLLLEAHPPPDRLAELMATAGPAYNDSAFEVKRYLWQRLRQLGEEAPALAAAAQAALQRPEARGVRGNWDAHALRGVSTALTRRFARGPGANASLSTVQETSGGLLKRGAVDVRLERHGATNTLFSLGIFAGGLGSFVSSGAGEEEGAGDEEPATAGLELTVLGVGVRPFVFFAGQGELMGHVWSGTGSERTPAFQVLTLLQDHQQSIPLQCGFVAELTLTGAASFDLAGQIQLSLWNRNAQSLVEKNVALLLQGLLRVDSSFVRSQVEFNVATEPRLELSSDVDFYDKVALCMQLRQPDAELRLDFIIEVAHKLHNIVEGRGYSKY